MNDIPPVALFASDAATVTLANRETARDNSVSNAAMTLPERKPRSVVASEAMPRMVAMEIACWPVRSSEQ